MSPLPHARAVRIAALCLALAAVPALAQAPAAPVPSGEDAPPWVSPPAAAPFEQPPAARPAGLVRGLGELGAGVLLGAGLGVGGGLLGEAMCDDPPGTFLRCLKSGMGGMVLGVATGFPLGVWGGGRLLGGHGSLLATYAGMALSIGGALLGASAKSDVLTAVSLLSFPITTIAGYELSDSIAFAQQQAPSGASVTPLLSLGPSGTQLGLRGRF